MRGAAMTSMSDTSGHTSKRAIWGKLWPSMATGAFEVAEDTLTASQRLLTRYPDAQIWCIRIGHRGVHRFGWYPIGAGER